MPNANWVEEQDFYELMQSYRHAPLSEQEKVMVAFEAVKKFIREHFTQEQP